MEERRRPTKSAGKIEQDGNPCKAFDYTSRTSSFLVCFAEDALIVNEPWTRLSSSNGIVFLEKVCVTSLF